MLLFPNAKINIGLNVVQKREDGYHNIETVFYPIQLRDALEVLANNYSSETCSFTTEGIPLECTEENNLILKAYRLLKRDHSIPAVKIYLQKMIPLGAGLGGGSSDASYMIKCIDRLFELNLSLEVMEQYALELGADCPFFIRNEPIFATGIGELFHPIALDLSNYYLILICPPIHISTAQAFRGIVPHIPQVSIPSILQKDIRTWKDVLQNDFEEVIFALYPEIANIKRQLYHEGALYASMSGSGSAIYGIFETETRFNSSYFSWSGYLK